MKIPFLSRSRRSPEDVYEKMVINLMISAVRSAPKTPLLAKAFRVLPKVVLGGCVVAPNAWTNVEPLKQHWPDASDGEKQAVGEVCTLEVLAYVFAFRGDSESVVASYAARVDDLFAHSFPNATDFARSLYKQVLSDNADAVRRKKAGEPGAALHAGVMAVQGVVSAAGLSQLPMQPLPERFPVRDSASLAEAGVPLPSWDGIVSDLLVYHQLLVDSSVNAIKELSGGDWAPGQG